jgi:hypothetical protein
VDHFPTFQPTLQVISSGLMLWILVALRQTFAVLNIEPSPRFWLNSNVLQDIRLFFSSLTPHHLGNERSGISMKGNERSGISMKAECFAITESAVSAEQISPRYWRN